jgi:RNA polymerase sigma-70 factor (family 1)
VDNSGQESEQEYADSFQRGEEKGFTYFFKSLYPALVFYASRFLQDRTTSEDVVSESFKKIWDRHEAFSHPKVIKSWMYTTVRNGSLTRLQNTERIQNYQDQLVRNTEGLSESSVLDEITKIETIRELHAHIKSLPTECSKIFKKLYIEGKTVREAAEELNLSISTIKNQKARGLGILKKKMGGFSVIFMLPAL